MQIFKNDSSLKQKVENKKIQTTVLQRYISNPLLVHGLKFHCRLHVLVTNIDVQNVTYRAFLHNFSYLEFATVPYKKNDRVFNPKMHLTNNWINWRKEKIEYRWPPLDKDGKEYPWNAELLSEYFGENVETFFWKQARPIAKASVEAVVKHSAVKKLNASINDESSKNFTMFKFLGIDVMFDEDYKLWLLECNNSPGLNMVKTKDDKGAVVPSWVEYNKRINQFLEGSLDIVGFDNRKQSATTGFWDISS